MHFAHRTHHVAESGHDQRRHLEAQVHAHGANMKENIARRDDGVMTARQRRDWVASHPSLQPAGPFPASFVLLPGFVSPARCEDS